MSQARRGALMLVTARSNLEGYQVATYKGIAQGPTLKELVREARALGANAILSTCYDNALDIETLYHGTAVILEPSSLFRRPRGAPKREP